MTNNEYNGANEGEENCISDRYIVNSGERLLQFMMLEEINLKIKIV